MPLFIVPGPIIGVAPVREISSCGNVSNYQAPSKGWRLDAAPARLSAANKLTLPDQQAEVSSESAVCMSLSGERFADLIMGLCEDAVGYVQQRKAELIRWDGVAKARVQKWFGSTDEVLKLYLLNGLNSMLRVLGELSPDNFIDHTIENAELTGCLREANLTTNAAACAVDTVRHRIMINPNFFILPKYSYSFGSKIFDGKDSQLMTLIHEVSHFNDVLGTGDPFYGVINALAHASSPAARTNADSITAYILGMNVSLPRGVSRQ